MAAAGMRTWTDALANVHGLAAAAGKCKGGQAGRQAGSAAAGKRQAHGQVGFVFESRQCRTCLTAARLPPPLPCRSIRPTDPGWLALRHSARRRQVRRSAGHHSRHSGGQGAACGGGPKHGCKCAQALEAGCPLLAAVWLCDQAASALREAYAGTRTCCAIDVQMCHLHASTCTGLSLHTTRTCCILPTLQAALAKGLLSTAQLEQAVAAAGAGQLLNLSQLLPAGDAKAQQLLATPVHVVAFSDEEGVRRVEEQCGCAECCCARLLKTLLPLAVPVGAWPAGAFAHLPCALLLCRFQSTFLGSRAVAGSLDEGAASVVYIAGQWFLSACPDRAGIRLAARQQRLSCALPYPFDVLRVPDFSLSQPYLSMDQACSRQLMWRASLFARL